MPATRTAPQPRAGTTTFLHTEVEPATTLWEIAPEVAAAAIGRHATLIQAAVAAHGGVLADRTDQAGADQTRADQAGTGAADSLSAAFTSATRAVDAALAIQQAFTREQWPAGLAIRVRVGLHTAEVDGQASVESAAHRCSRVCEVAHGGQTLLSQSTAALVADALPDGAWLEDLGVHRLRDLARPEPLATLRHHGLAGGFAPVRSLDVLPNNLPAQLTSFVGRGAELTRVRRLLATQRLVTFAGSGGCGKTRLAVQAAAEAADGYPDGVWWVELGSVTDPELVARQTAATLRVLVEPDGDPLAALASQLRGRRRLLVCLDTCEHVLDACAELADTLLRACPAVSVLATSREPLGVAGETVWRVPSLAPAEAVSLFADRAALAQPAFSLAAHQDAVGMVCHRLDGIPLAVELAAAWVRALSPAQIAARLDDRFALLTGGPRGGIARHRTLAASIDWSHALLAEPDQVVFRRLAVFAGGFDLDAAQAVGADGPAAAQAQVRPERPPERLPQGHPQGRPTQQRVLDTLARLVDKSLVVAEEDGGALRYRLLDTIRQYSADRLDDAGETAATRDRHLDHFLAFAEAAEPELERDQDTWRAALEAQHDNLRAALRWGLAAPDPDRGRRLAAALARLWFLHGHIREGRRFLDQALGRVPEDRSVLQARLLSGAAMLGLGGGQPTAAADAAARGLEIAEASGDDRARGRCLVMLAYGPFYRDGQAAEELTRQAQAAGEAAGDPVATDYGFLLRSVLLGIRDRHHESAALGQELLARVLPRGERFCAVFSYENQAYAALFTGDVRRAVALATEAAGVAEPLGDHFTVGHTLSNLAWINSVAGDLDGGRRLLAPIAPAMEEADLVGVSWMALALGKLHLYGGDLEGAVAWLERGTQFADPTTDNWVVARSLPGLAGALRRLGRLDDARGVADRAVAMARKIGAQHVLAEALEETAFLAAADDPARAEDLHHQALAVRVQHGLRTFWVDSLEALAALAAAAGGSEEAARLLGACDPAREQMGYPRPAVNQPGHDQTLAAVREALGEDAFAAAWAQGAALSLDDAVAYATRARGARDRPSSGWGSLTPTEREVVGLVVEGLTNPAIAARLFMSRATVKTHLSHIYAKLGVANRTELATLAGSQPTPTARPED